MYVTFYVQCKFRNLRYVTKSYEITKCHTFNTVWTLKPVFFTNYQTVSNIVYGLNADCQAWSYGPIRVYVYFLCRILFATKMETSFWETPLMYHIAVINRRKCPRDENITKKRYENVTKLKYRRKKCHEKMSIMKNVTKM